MSVLRNLVFSRLTRVSREGSTISALAKRPWAISNGVRVKVGLWLTATGDQVWPQSPQRRMREPSGPMPSRWMSLSDWQLSHEMMAMSRSLPRVGVETARGPARQY